MNETQSEADIARMEKFHAKFVELKRELAKTIVGQEAMIDEVLTAVFARGHVLLTGVPGLAKTLLVRTIAETMQLDFKRVQFEKRMEELSEGQRKKVLLARSLCESAHVYIWDEPLNFIDVFSRIQLERLILESCPTMVFVEHDKAFVEITATKRINL